MRRWAAIRRPLFAWNVSKLSQRSGGWVTAGGGEGKNAGDWRREMEAPHRAGGARDGEIGRAFCAVSYEL